MMCDFSKYIVRDTVTIREALIALNRLSDDVLVLFVVDSGNCLVGTLTDGDIPAETDRGGRDFRAGERGYE